MTDKLRPSKCSRSRDALVNNLIVDLVTFRVSRRQREISSDHGRLCVCVSVGLSVCLSMYVSVPRRILTLLHRPGCKLGEWYRGAP